MHMHMRTCNMCVCLYVGLYVRMHVCDMYFCMYVRQVGW